MRRFNWPDDTPLNEAILQALGAASMCWSNPEGAGVFQPDQAIKIGEELAAFITARYPSVTDDQ